MLNKLFKRMAPLVAGMILAASVVTLPAAYPYITNMERNGNTVTVSVQNPPPAGYGVPGYYYWWVDQNRASQWDGFTSITVQSTNTNACVYVYPTSGSDYSYAIHDTVNGVTIWNGP